jgi:hypothetical protein
MKTAIFSPFAKNVSNPQCLEWTLPEFRKLNQDIVFPEKREKFYCIFKERPEGDECQIFGSFYNMNNLINYCKQINHLSNLEEYKIYIPDYNNGTYEHFEVGEFLFSNQPDELVHFDREGKCIKYCLYAVK